MAAHPADAAERLPSGAPLPVVRVNLLPLSQRAGREHRIRLHPGRVVPIMLIAALAGAVTTIAFLEEQAIRHTRTRVESLAAEKAKLESEVQAVVTLRERQADLARRLAVIEALSRNRRRAVEEADALPRALPERLWLTDATFTDSLRASFAGVALSPLTVADLVARLDSTDVFHHSMLVVAEAGLIDNVPVTRFVVRTSMAR